MFFSLFSSCSPQASIHRDICFLLLGCEKKGNIDKGFSLCLSRRKDEKGIIIIHQCQKKNSNSQCFTSSLCTQIDRLRDVPIVCLSIYTSRNMSIGGLKTTFFVSFTVGDVVLPGIILCKGSSGCMISHPDSETIDKKFLVAQRTLDRKLSRDCLQAWLLSEGETRWATKIGQLGYHYVFQRL